MDNSMRTRQGYLVGGSLRDILLGKLPEDIDLVFHVDTLNSVISELEQLDWGKVILLDEQRLVYRFIPSGSKLHFDLSPIQGDHIREDLLKRDFTINAMAISLDSVWSLRNSTDQSETLYSLYSFFQDFDQVDIDKLKKQVIDPLDGILDLQRRRLHPVSLEILTEDPLRCVRAGRFYGMGYEPSPQLLELLKNRPRSWREISNQRLYQELDRIWRQLSLSGAVETWGFFQSTGIAEKLSDVDSRYFGSELHLDLDNRRFIITVLEKQLNTEKWGQVYPHVKSRELSALLWYLTGFSIQKAAIPNALQAFLEASERGYIDCIDLILQNDNGNNEVKVIERQQRYDLYASRLASARDIDEVHYYALGILLSIALHGLYYATDSEKVESSLSELVKQEHQLLQSLLQRYYQVTDKYNGDRLCHMVGREAGPWLSSALAEVHYLALLDREDEINLILPGFKD